MAFDGVKILESDYAIDIQNEIFDLYNDGKSENEIQSYLHQELKSLERSIDIEVFVSASALSLWKIGINDEIIANELKSIVSKGADVFWQENFDEKTVVNRGRELQKLVDKIAKPTQRKRKQQQVKKQLTFPFEQGDVLCVKFDGEYGCMVYEGIEQFKTEAYIVFIPINYHQNAKPSIDDLLVEEVPMTKSNQSEMGVRTLGIYYPDIEKLKPDFEKIGMLKINDCFIKNGFKRRKSLNTINELNNEIKDILKGEKTDVYNVYSL